MTEPNGKNFITNSRRGAFMTCPRKHQFAYEIAIRPTSDAPALRIGSCVHDALDIRKRGATMTQAIAEALANYVQDDFDDPERIAAMLTGYEWRWPDGAFKVLATERVMTMPLINPSTGHASFNFTVAMKVDAIIELQDARVAVMEHKTCSEDLSPESDYWKRLRIDAQISTYMLGARHNGFDVQTVVYDVLRKPLLRPSQIPLLDGEGRKIVLDARLQRVVKANNEPRQSADKEKGYVLQTRVEEPHEYHDRLMTDIYANPDWYYSRREIPRIKSDLEEAQLDLWNVAKMIRESELNNWHPRNDAACKSFGCTCPYFKLCTNGFSIEDFKQTGVVPEYYEVVQDVHPELHGE